MERTLDKAIQSAGQGYRATKNAMVRLNGATSSLGGNKLPADSRIPACLIYFTMIYSDNF